MQEQPPKCKLTPHMKDVLNGLGAYSTHSGIPFGEWQANRIMVKQKMPQKGKIFMDFKK